MTEGKSTLASPGLVQDPLFDAGLALDADESLVCSVCKHVLRDAMEAPCGHAFCRVCLEELSKAAQLKGTVLRQTLCPECHQTMTEGVQPGEDLRRQVDQQVVRCVFYASGCKSWVGHRSELKAHLAVCEHAEVMCPHAECQASVKRSLSERHIKDECPKRRVHCAHCQATHTFDDTTTHLGQCLRLVVPCSLQCGAKMERSRVPEHVATTCALQVVDCPYATKTGCSAKMQRRAVAQHMAEPAHVGLHLDGALTRLDETAEAVRVLRERVSVLESTTRRFEEALSCLRKTEADAKMPLVQCSARSHKGWFINKAPSLSNVTVRDVVDVLDLQRLWCPAVVEEVKGTCVLIHYLTWNAKWNEWIDLAQTRVADRILQDFVPAARVTGAFTKCVLKAHRDTIRGELATELEPFLCLTPTQLAQGGYTCCNSLTR